ncbi:MAG: hypothetical protein M1832_003752 [Thelocarpon impressellum]|nr:MAG: hypothetical protein M1832_003752 [Thelocarpon impressellum]
MISVAATVLLGLLPLVAASPVAQPAAAALPRPVTTPSPVEWSPSKTRRALTDDVKSILGGLGSSIPSYVASGVPNFFQDFPVGGDVQKSLGLDDAQISALPTQVINVPPYANWTDQGWNVRFHGNVFKQPDIPQEKVDELADKFLIDTSVKDLPPNQAAQARNVTRSIFVLQQDDETVTFTLEPASGAGSSGQQGGSGAVTPGGGSQQIRFPVPTTDQGDYDGFVPIANTSGGLQPGNATSSIQRLNVYTIGTDTGNATAYLVPTEGVTMLSDIDDILRVTKIYQPKEGLLNSFARPFTPWLNMPEIYANLSKSLPNMHFHYLTTTPEQITKNYMQFIYAAYPGGSFDTRPLNFSDVSATLSIRKFLLTKVFQTFPKRKFILVGDTTNSDVMRGYPELATDFPGQVLCILLRNTSATDPENKFPYDTSGFKDLNTNSYMFFNVPDDLKNLDLANGQCVNATVKQEVTFGVQGLPFGLGKKGAGTAVFQKPSIFQAVLSAGLSVVFAALFIGL